VPLSGWTIRYNTIILEIMAKFTISTSSKLSPSESYNKVKSILETDPDLRKLDSNYECIFDDLTLTGTSKGKFFKAIMSITPKGDGSIVVITVELSFALSLAKSSIEKALSTKLTSALS